MGFSKGLAAGTGAAGEVGNEGGVLEAEPGPEPEPGMIGKAALVGIFDGAGAGAGAETGEGAAGTGEGDARVGIFEGNGEGEFRTGDVAVVLFFSRSRYISINAAVLPGVPEVEPKAVFKTEGCLTAGVSLAGGAGVDDDDGAGAGGVDAEGLELEGKGTVGKGRKALSFSFV